MNALPAAGDRWGLDAYVMVYAHYTVGYDDAEQFILANTGHIATPWAVFVSWEPEMPFKLWHYSVTRQDAEVYLVTALKVAQGRQHAEPRLEFAAHGDPPSEADQAHPSFGLFG